MNLLNLLIELASTPVQQRDLTDLLAKQSPAVQQAFVSQDNTLLKQQLRGSSTDEVFANERTVVQVSLDSCG
jgi:hypothetical protein